MFSPNSALDELLASSPNRHVAKVWCARVALITGIALFVSVAMTTLQRRRTEILFVRNPQGITTLWTVHSNTLLLRLGQAPEIATPASQFLQVAAAGMPGYALGEIAK